MEAGDTGQPPPLPPGEDTPSRLSQKACELSPLLPGWKGESEGV